MLSLCPHCGERIAKPKRKRIAQKLPGVPRKAAKEAKRQRHAIETAHIRLAVWDRSRGRCEAYGEDGFRCQGVAHILDHWDGGSGRRRQRQTVATCWALCVRHSDQRTANWPSAAWWNASREAHCLGNAILFTPHIERASSPRGLDAGRPPLGDARPDTKDW